MTNLITQLEAQMTLISCNCRPVQSIRDNSTEQTHKIEINDLNSLQPFWPCLFAKDKYVFILTPLSHQGADFDSIDCKGNSPLLLATSCSAWRTVTLLLSKGDRFSYDLARRYCKHCTCAQRPVSVIQGQTWVWKTDAAATFFTLPSCSPRVWKTFQRRSCR